MKNKTTKQLTELTFNQDMNTFIPKYLADKAVSNCDYLYNINRDNLQKAEHEMMKEFESNPESSSPKLAEWEQDILRAEKQMSEWQEASKMIVKQIVAVYPDYVKKATATKSKADLISQAKARFANRK